MAIEQDETKLTGVNTLMPWDKARFLEIRAIHAADGVEYPPDQFKAVAQAIEQQAQAGTPHAQNAVSTAPQATGASTPAAAPDHAPTAWFWPALLTGGLALLVLAWWRRAPSRPAPRRRRARDAPKARACARRGER